MSGRIIPLRETGCEQAQELLPWLVTGALAPVEEAGVRAHIADCRACQAELRIEEQLRDEVAAMPTQVDLAWRGLAPRLKTRKPARDPRAWVGWAIAAQFVLLAGGAALVTRPEPAREAYHALGARTAPASANILVMFRPETTEARMRAALHAAGARLVDGPTEANAYLLAVPQARRTHALAALSVQREVTLAQPIDADSRR